MIELKLQMFGTGSSGAGKGAGGKGKSTSKESVSSNAPGSGRGGGGRQMDGGSPAKKADVSKITDKNGNVTNVVPGYRYNVYKVVEGKESLYDYNWSAADTKDFLEGMSFDKKSGTYAEQYRIRYRIKIAKTKTKKKK